MLHRYQITPKSPVMTPLMSDTFFGHFCWAILYEQGEESLTDFLNSYDNENPAPVLFSSAFPFDSLPRPALPSMKRELLKEFVREHFGEGKEECFHGFLTIKAWNKRQFISLNKWENLKNAYSEDELYKCFFEEEESSKDTRYFETELTGSNSINRLTNTAPEKGGGGFFQREKTWYHEDKTLDLYVEVNDQQWSEFVHLFLVKYLPENGFGADKSIGMGHLEIKKDENFDENAFKVKDANARLCLSLTSFPGMGSYEASYNLKTKFGKLGGNFAFSSPTKGPVKPFKKPILMYEPGAVFFCKQSLSNQCLLKNVHSDKRIRHYGIPITLPFKLEES
ncbi:CRISPR-associated protein Csm4 [Candidatus Magnetomoraceae bacterium gMMP-15]